MVAGPPTGTPDQRRGAGDIATTLAQAMDRAGDGVVLLGPLASSGRTGILGALRASPAAEDVSTVDVSELGAGAVLAVRALQGQAEGTTLHLGSGSSADGAFPGAR